MVNLIQSKMEMRVKSPIDQIALTIVLRPGLKIHLISVSRLHDRKRKKYIKSRNNNSL